MYSVYQGLLNNIETTDYIFKDYNQRIIIPPESFLVGKIYTISVEDNNRLDIISVNEYGNNTYVDLIMLLNEMNTLDLPKSIDFVESAIDRDFLVVISKIPYPLSEDDKKRIRNEISDKLYKENELYRNLRLVKPEYLSTVLREIKNVNTI